MAELDYVHTTDEIVAINVFADVVDHAEAQFQSVCVLWKAAPRSAQNLAWFCKSSNGRAFDFECRVDGPLLLGADERGGSRAASTFKAGEADHLAPCSYFCSAFAMPPIWTDVLSVFTAGVTNPIVAEKPELGARLALADDLQAFTAGHPSIIAAVRHCGCPFAEREVRQLAALSNKHRDLRVVVICHSAEADATEWFANIGGNEFSDKAHVKLVADPERRQYAALGLGLLSWGQLFSRKVIAELGRLRDEEKIVNTTTRTGSNRWQNSGGFAVSADGRLKWSHVAVDASDMCDYEAAAKSLELSS